LNSRLRAGLLITFAVVSLMAGAQAAQACTEPALGDLPARGQEKKLVRFELTGLTPGSEYLLKVNGRERKEGIATTDRVSRRFRMPNLGDSNRRVKVEVVIAHDECENSPWKLDEKMTYRPQPEPQAPAAQPDPAPAPAPTPAPEVNSSPSPPPAPTPPAAPSVTDPAPDPPAVPKSSIAPTPAAPTATPNATPPKGGREWTTPVDPYQRGENDPPKASQGVLSRLDRPSEIANSTVALIGLGGLFLLLAGIAAIGWTRFRSYDDDRLEELLNPEGKLPRMLDPNAKDMAGARPPRRPKRPSRKAALPTFDPTAPGAEGKAEAEAAPAPRQRRPKRPSRKAALPTFDPTAPGAEAAAAAAAAAGGKDERSDDPQATGRLQRLRRRLRRKDAPSAPASATPVAPKAPAPPPAAGSPSPSDATEKPTVKTPAGTAPNGKPSPSAVPPITAPHVNGTGHVNGTPPAPPPPAAKPPADAAAAPKGDAAAQRAYREEVETELQRILDNAGLNTQVDGILADAKKEAERQGVPIDSDLMLKALCDESNGANKLSDSAKGELESRFRRIVAEERGEQRRPPGN